MFAWYRLRRVHGLYLESSRNLHEGRVYWSRAGGCRRAFLDFISPVPLMGLHEDGALLLKALRWLEESCRSRALSEEVLCQYHRILFPKESEQGGRYRKGAVNVKKSTVPRPAAAKVSVLMKQLDQKLARDQQSWDGLASAPPAAEIVQTVAAIHQRIAFIHPFQDGNGRVARLGMNHVLRRYGLGYAILPPLDESQAHFDALEEAHKGRGQAFSEFVTQHLRKV